MAEEHGCQAPEGHRLCANNCGFLGSPATMNLCSTCYKDYCLKEQQHQQQEPSSMASLAVPSPSLSAAAVATYESAKVSTSPLTVEVTVAENKKPDRCSVCRKRVGLTDFRCRCENMFCGKHRFPEKHSCTYNYKKIGREQIARANPMVVAEKLHKI